ncbi:MAG TPA: glutamate-cysteine ligase family protein [Desulfurivibrionaceae bacterium]|nr:glutamate-cysteine ligase family protein [Desulfurivibrionaceae bacterium]
MKSLHLFDAIGVELEYMLVDAQSLDVRPISDQVLAQAAGEPTSHYDKPGISWSNELVLHVLELKTTEPTTDLAHEVGRFHADVQRINTLLTAHHARLMPGGAHPWMNPYEEMHLWPHGDREIYAAFNRIFDCRGHGWANLQSCHLNLPFQGDEEFGRLHAAIRLILPLLPAIAASTPIVDGRVQSALDFRLETYKTNSAKLPRITGLVVPEPVYSEAAYREQILAPMYQSIAPFDPEGTLQDEWLNARGAIARFDRDAIEIRIIDVQECPLADLAIASLIVETLRSLVNETWAGVQEQQRWQTAPLAGILNATVKEAEAAIITDPAYLKLFGLNEQNATAGQVWQHLFAYHQKQGIIPALFHAPLAIILNQGCLARRMLRALGPKVDKGGLATLAEKLCQSLADNTLLGSG